jgi:hypothetical protein
MAAFFTWILMWLGCAFAPLAVTLFIFWIGELLLSRGRLCGTKIFVGPVRRG